MGERILIVDDEASVVVTLTALLRQRGYEVTSAQTGAAALEVVRRESIGLTLLDIGLGAESGLDVLPELKRLRPEMSVVILTGKGTIENAVEAMRRGADHFVVKDKPPSVVTVVEKGLETYRLRRQSLQLERLRVPSQPMICSADGAMSRVLQLVEKVAERETTVLLQGEMGTGKELLARMIHDASPRQKEPFVQLNCAALPRELTESELFGHERGAFTGADRRKIGLFEVAHEGTLFLDEISKMDMGVQAKLLNVVEQKRIRRLGGEHEIEVDVRLIAATNRDLAREVVEGRFLEDLWYRLNVFMIELPPLRERREDILPLAWHFLREFQDAQSPVPGISQAVEETLLNYHWPGNVRELRNVMERAVILCSPDSEILPFHLPSLGASKILDSGSVLNPPSAIRHPPSVSGFSSLSRAMEDFEREYLKAALEFYHWNKNATAQALDIARATLYEKIEKYNLSPEE